MDVSLLTITGFLIILLLINTYLYYKLWSLERMVDFEYVNMENSKYFRLIFEYIIPMLLMKIRTFQIRYPV